MVEQALISVAKERGLQTDHVVWLGTAGMQDWNLVPYAIDRNYTLVANNSRDFLREYTKLAVHDGLIIVVPLLDRDDQIRLFDLALDFVLSPPDTVNKLVEVFSDGEIRVRDWSSADSDPSYLRSPSRKA